MGHPVAVKMLPVVLVSNKRAYAQVKAEALVSLKLSHPNIATVRAFEEEGGNPFLVMDYIDGRTLDDYLAEKGRLTEAETVKLLTPVAAALDYAHRKGVVHRDVKPGNVMIAKDGTPYVLDFGIAREIQETMTRVTGRLSSGTLLYMSPEQLHGAAPKPAQDVYSFAAMAYECLKGEPPFSRGQIEFQIEHDTPAPLPSQATIAGGVMAGLEKVPEARPTTCLAVLGGGTRAGAPAASTGKMRIMIGAGLLALVTALGGWLWWKQDKSAEPAAEYARPAEAARQQAAAERTAKLETERIAAAPMPRGVQLWENGPYWAECNVGATKPEEYGYYFWWGDTVGYKRNASSNGWESVANGASFSFSRDNCLTDHKTTSQLKLAGYIDSTGNLVAAHDAATAHLGAPWRMPTDAEFLELFVNCDTKWTTRNGVYGRLVTGCGAYASKSIFLPAAGYGRDSGLDNPGSCGGYWSSSPFSDSSYDAWGFGFLSDAFCRYNYFYRYFGQSVRPLRGFAQ